MSTFATPESPLPALSEGQRLLYTFVEPSKTMEDLRRNTSWWVPWLLMSVFAVAFCVTVEKKIGWGQIMETQIQSNPKAAEKMDKMAPEQREKIMKVQETTARVMGYASPVTMLLMLMIVGAAVLGIFNFGFGCKLSFGQSLAITSYAYLPSLINSLLMILILFIVPAESFNIQSPLATNPGYFVPATEPFLKSVLGTFDVFTIWEAFLIGLGVSKLSKVKPGVAFATLMAVVLVLKIVGGGLASI